jgi:hypothetical protein
MLVEVMGASHTQVRIQYERAIYHLIKRGDRREQIFRDDVAGKAPLEALAEQRCAGKLIV